jgi:hypothetical protein
MTRNQQIMDSHGDEQSSAATRAAEVYWRTYAAELDRQFAAQRAASWIMPRLDRPVKELGSLWGRIVGILCRVESHQGDKRGIS